jgi:DNA integrity scanning protein DisA with diadenylate cyclase activity
METQAEVDAYRNKLQQALETAIRRLRGRPIGCRPALGPA